MTQRSPRKSPRLNDGQEIATTASGTQTKRTSRMVSTVSQMQVPAVSAPQSPSTVDAGTSVQPAGTVAAGVSARASTLTGAPSPSTQLSSTQVMDLTKRVAVLEHELQRSKTGQAHVSTVTDPVKLSSAGMSGTANLPPSLIGAESGEPSSSGSLSETATMSVVPNSKVSLSETAILSGTTILSRSPSLSEALPTSLSGNLGTQLQTVERATVMDNCSTTSSRSTPYCFAGIAQPTLSYTPAQENQQTIILEPTQATGNFAWTTPRNDVCLPRKLPDLPEFGGQPEDWPIFFCAFTETTLAYNCTNLENNQRLLKALKGEARDTVKSLLIHPRNVNNVIEQLRFRYGRPEQLIRSQLISIREVQPIQEHSIAKIVPYATRVSNLAAFLQSANGEQHLANPTLMEDLVAKLPPSKRLEWARHAATIRPFPTVVHFSAWLTDYANVVCTIVDVDSKEQRRRVLHASIDQNNEGRHRGRTKQCPICNGQHAVRDCNEFNLASPLKRWTVVKRHRLCFSCLRVGHMARVCNRANECQVNGCRKRHHRLLHYHDAMSHNAPQPAGDRVMNTGRMPQPADPHTRAPQPADAQSTQQRNLSCVDSDGERLLFRILPVTLHGANKRIDTYALLDEGSSVTMIDDELLRDLDIKGERRQLNIQWFGGRATREPTTVVSMEVSGADKRKRHVLRNVYAVSNLSLPMQSLHQRDVQMWGNGARLPMKPYRGAVPKLLIGLDHAHLGLPMQTKRFAPQGPYAAATELGWVVFGPARDQPTATSSKSCLLAVSQEDAIQKMVNDYFDIENFGVKLTPPVAASDDARAQRILEDTTVKIEERYQTGLLWNRDNVELPRSYDMAYKRLVNIERKMKRNDQFKQAYMKIMDDYVHKGYSRRLKQHEVALANSDKLWYLPHFGVENPNKPGKIRLVFDAAAKVGDISLNSALSKGPQHYKSLPAVLFHFREGAVGVCGDIREMFHQVLIRPQDRCAQRFLWRNGDDRREPDVYEMRVMTFGAACSPSAAHYVKTLNALQFQDSDPRAVKAILECHYVDDYVDSFDSEGEAITISTRIREIHANAGFELCQFTSSSPTVADALGQHGTARSIGWGEAEEKILGMCWQPATDDFKFNMKYHKVPRCVLNLERIPTKREFLSLIISTFDPLGFLSCLMITGKLLMREIWRRNVQ
ncbi:uncharacterized protein [Drosophila virilis]|uniref:uncharacterized protein n=1 Tax=Drosophila virilis TaxID=7244 RepID=UPI0013964877|nr:uncharacterized protein LOC116649899 [Drosophila virilis]